MANPFLVLGGIAVGVVVAAFGVLQIPGWVQSAKDAAAVNDLGSVAASEAASLSLGLKYLSGTELVGAADKLGTNFTVSDGVQLCITRNDDASAYAAVARSSSGAYFARTSDTVKPREGSTADQALAVIGGLPAGVPAPFLGENCAPGAEVGGAKAPDKGPDLGPTTTMGAFLDATHTSHGVYVVDQKQVGGSLVGRLVRSGADGLPHEVAATGVLSDSNFTLQRDMGIASDAQENLYVGGILVTETGPQWSVVKVTPKFTSSVVATMPRGANWTRFASSPSGDVYYWVPSQAGAKGEFYKLASNGPKKVGEWGGSGELMRYLKAADDGTLYFHGITGAKSMTMSPDGTVKETGHQINGTAQVMEAGKAPGSDGRVYGVTDNGILVAFAKDGSASQIADIKPALPSLTGKWGVGLYDADSAGNLYGRLFVGSTWTSTTADYVIKLSPKGKVEIIMANQGAQLGAVGESTAIPAR